MSKRTKYLLGIGVIAALVIGWQVAAFAVHDEGAFQLDGNAVTNPSPPAPFPGDDWDRVFAGTSSAEDTAFVTEPNPNSDFFTGGGSKDPQDIPNWQWKDETGGLPDKSNLQHSYAASYTVGGDKLLYFGADRFDGSGDAAIGFWFFQNAITKQGTGSGTFTGDPEGTHENGDVLVISNFSNGGTVPTITVYKWDDTCTKAANNNPQAGQCGAANLRVLMTQGGGTPPTSADCANPTDDRACAIVNSADGTTAPWPFTDKSGSTTFKKGEFFEGGINLSALGLGNSCFATALAETRTSTSPTSTLKDFTLGSFGDCTSGIRTEQQGDASKPIGTGSIQVTDKAFLDITGAPTWNGTVQFSLTGPIGTPLEETEDIGNPVAVSNSTTEATSPAATVTAVGDYCWSAHFDSNTTGVPDSDDNGENECFTVTPTTPTLATTAGPDVLLGNSISDTADLSGTATKPGTDANGDPDPINPANAGAPAGGNITFTAYGPNDCTTVAFGPSSQFAVTGNGTYGPASFTPNAIGTYHWVATYSGDSPNTNGTDHNTNCQDANEDVVVSSVPSGITTAQSFIPNDEATVTASQGGNLAGSVTFEVFESSDCSGTAIYDEDVAVSGASPQTVETSNTEVSTTAANISWRVSYDSTNPAQDDIPATCKEATALDIDNDTTQP